MGARLPIVLLALLVAAVGCGGKKKSLYKGASGVLREPISAKPLTGEVFDEPFEVVSGYAYSQPLGGGSVKLFDREVTPCQGVPQLGDGRMVSITIPDGIIEFFFDSFADSKAIEASIVFVNKGEKVSSASAEFKRTELTEDTFTAGLSATDVTNNYVNGMFTVELCAAKSGEQPSTQAVTSTTTSTTTTTATSESTSTQTSTDASTSGTAVFTIADLPAADDAVPKFVRVTLTLAGTDAAAVILDADAIKTHTIADLAPGSYLWTVEYLTEDEGVLIASATGEVEVTAGATTDVSVALAN